MLSWRVLLWHTMQIGRSSCKVQIWVNHIHTTAVYFKKGVLQARLKTRKYLPEQCNRQSFKLPFWFWLGGLILNPTTQFSPFPAWLCQFKSENKSSLDKWLLAWLKQTSEWKATQIAETTPVCKINPGTIRSFLLKFAIVQSTSMQRSF